MLGDPLTITLDGEGGTQKVLPRIGGGADGYSSEYFLDETTVQWRVKIRHSKDTVRAGSQPFDRHTVTFSRFLKPTYVAGNQTGSLSEVSFTVRNDPNGIQGDIVDLSEALSYFMVKAGGIAPKLIGWQS